MRPGPDGEIVAVQPVIEIVDRAPPAPGVGGHLVLLETEVAQQRLAEQLDARGRVGIGKTGGRAGVEHGIRLEGQLVPGQVLGAEAGRRLDVGERRGACLARQRIHEIEVDVVEAGVPGGGEGQADVGSPVDPAQPG